MTGETLRRHAREAARWRGHTLGRFVRGTFWTQTWTARCDRPHGTIGETQRIVDAPEPLAMVKGRTLRTFARLLASLSDDDRAALFDGIPLDWMVTDR